MHPDRLVGASADEIERAHFKMGELNQAWEVLRDPERRARYDAAGRGSGGAPGPPLVAGLRHGAAIVPPSPARSVAELEREVVDQPTVVHRRRWSRHGPALAVAALLLMVAVVGCLATVTQDPEPTNVETTERFPVGSCVVVSLDQTIDEAACTRPGARQIVAKEAFPRPCPADTEAVVLLEQDVSLCLPRTTP
jgi:hypothetical protein